MIQNRGFGLGKTHDYIRCKTNEGIIPRKICWDTKYVFCGSSQDMTSLWHSSAMALRQCSSHVSASRVVYVSNDELELHARLMTDTAYHRQLRDIFAPPSPRVNDDI